jgi:GTPase Era involved in 16S rRNA processing
LKELLNNIENMESSSSIPYSIIPFGAPGSGKSNLCNILVGKKDKFISSKTAESG